MSDLTFTFQRSQFIGFGISWNRRDMFNYGWVTFEFPFIAFIIEWSPNDDALYAEYGIPEVKR